jgi:competence protein ComFC
MADVFDAVIPLRCAVCGAAGHPVCATCSAGLAAKPSMYRPACGDVPVILALGPYAGGLRAAVLNAKFRNRREAAIALGAILGAKLPAAFDAVVPLPLHAHRLRTRGFNQAAAIAQGIVSVLAAPLCEDALVRRLATLPQSSLALVDRKQNVTNAFARGPGSGALRGKNVLLVDDVVTTGATLCACARVLRECGVRRLSCAALAVTL